ncbi:hypothetical protein D915_010602 [Fasciola hepatica]|uniref:G-protein coupled receptors family 1 profile domain-containing protein n=1 Tax=Fasciola hepatica TaxID=6192 RepID=A0A4E0R9E2_FASHE|nr:hypothetical protein D915_010602 [Fasciola hepatica]
MNTITFCGIYRIQLGSILTRCLLYNECVIDLLTCITAFGTFIPCQTQEAHVERNVFMCYVIRNSFLISFLRALMTFNIVSLALDRFWAIVYCRTYKRRQKIYLIGCIAIIILPPCALATPNLFQVGFIENACVVIPDIFPIEAQMIFRIVLAYTTPLIIVSITGVWTLHVIRKERGLSTTVHHADSMADHSRIDDPSLVAVENTLSLATFGFCLVLAVLAIVGLVMSILSIMKLLDFRFDSVARMLFTCICGTASSIVPIIHIFAVPRLRRWYFGVIKCMHARIISMRCCMKLRAQS